MGNRSAQAQRWYRQLMLTAGMSPTLQEAATLVRDRIERRAGEGDSAAQELVARVHSHAWTHFTKEELRRGGGTFVAYFIAGPRRLRRAFSTTKRDRFGSIEGTRVDLIIHKSWAELDELLATQKAQAKTLEANVAVCRRALALRRRCPDSRTPAEAAWKLGLDINAYLAVGENEAVTGRNQGELADDYKPRAGEAGRL